MSVMVDDDQAKTNEEYTYVIRDVPNVVGMRKSGKI
jgi:hypothetical protein